jgi:hypothetical protein
MGKTLHYGVPVDDTTWEAFNLRRDLSGEFGGPSGIKRAKSEQENVTEEKG